MRSPGSGRDGHPATTARWWWPAVDLGVTVLLWLYFTAGFVVFFAPFYLLAAAVPPWRMTAFQGLNHLFYRTFFRLCRLLMPRQRWEIDEAVMAIRGQVVVCNHVSYIDPILLIALFPRHTTIVKARLFAIPIFGWMLRLSGYIPSATSHTLADVMLRRMETLCDDLDKGANLIVFPEGTRSRDGTIGSLNTGAFKLARHCRRAIQVIAIQGAGRLFTPGRFRFNTLSANTIRVTLVGRITPAYDDPDFSMATLVDRTRRQMVAAAAKESGVSGAAFGSTPTMR
jgi:1-acyl-sn-glycerol-3-phosphate acyltransferase